MHDVHYCVVLHDWVQLCECLQDSELRELRGTSALDKMEGRVQAAADAPTRVRQLWEELVCPFVQDHPRLRLPDGDKGWALYQWATAAVSSYSFILGDDKYHVRGEAGECTAWLSSAPGKKRGGVTGGQVGNRTFQQLGPALVQAGACTL